MPALFENRAGKFFAVLFPFVSNNGKIILYGKDQNALKAGVRISHFAALGAGAEFSWKFILRRGDAYEILIKQKTYDTYWPDYNCDYPEWYAVPVDYCVCKRDFHGEK